MRTRKRRGALAARALSTLLLGAVACAPEETATGSAADPLVGTWRLVRYVDAPDGDEPLYAFGEEPIGIVIFTEGGDFSVSFMRNPPGIDSADPDSGGCNPAWYCSWFGQYAVDMAKSEFVVDVEGGNIPSYLDTSQTRAFTLDGDSMTIAGEYQDAEGRTVRYERLFRRA